MTECDQAKSIGKGKSMTKDKITIVMSYLQIYSYIFLHILTYPVNQVAIQILQMKFGAKVDKLPKIT